MNDNNFDEFLRQQLQGSSHYIDDGDFTARVIANLPAQKRLSPWLEKLIMLLPATLIALWVLNQFSMRPLIQPAYAWLLTLDMQTLMSLAAMTLMVMLIAPILLFIRPQSFI